MQPSLLPETLDTLFDRAALGTFPTPITRLDRLSTTSGAEVWAKRDDFSGEQYGGNHLRKLNTSSQMRGGGGGKRVVTFSCLGSNYAVAMAIYGQRVGLPCEVVMSYKLPNLALRRNLLLTQHFGARIHYAKTFPGAGLRLGSVLFRSLAEASSSPPRGLGVTVRRRSDIPAWGPARFRRALA
jgi:1-aminocyclopropane-1-carboxylate deaminase/D-cysteine desulfhydrase-like pyridoxal-dependent ACC family enzyme